jgi:Tfp pilus assembly protein PilX
MAMNRRMRARENPRRGVALLVTLIFMSVMLSVGFTLAALAYKQSLLASYAIQSQYAFYAADAALECALYADQKQGAFIYSEYSATNPPNAATITQPLAANCNGTVVAGTAAASWTTSRLTVAARISFDTDTRCADVTIYKRADGRAFLYAEGYNTSCSAVSANNARIVARGLDAKY